MNYPRILFVLIASCVALVLSVITSQTATLMAADAYNVIPVDIYGAALREGDVISAHQSAGDPDVFIIKLKPFFGPAEPGDSSDSHNGYKRLFLNPQIFNMYGHLGSWARIRQVTATVRDSFVTSGIFRNCETEDERVWATEIKGEDVGILHHIEMSGAQAVLEDPQFFARVFCINSLEEGFYAKSIHAYTSYSSIPRYPRRGCYYQEVQCIRAPCNPVLVCPTPIPTPITSGGCVIGGCSNQLCYDSSSGSGVSTCEWRDAYACYTSARCERQSTGLCGWTQTQELTNCLANPPRI